MARRRWLLSIAVLALLVGCDPGSPDTSTGDNLRGERPERLRQQATDALARYDKALRDAGLAQRFVPVGDLTRQIGDWEPANGDHKRALVAGRFIATTQLPDAPRPTAKVLWDSGAEQEVPMISADEGIMQLVQTGTGDCPECEPLEIIEARTTTMKIETTRGPATVPAWEYQIRGTRVRVTRMAVASAAAVEVSSPSWDPANAPAGLIVESASTTVSSRTLTVSFTGTPQPKSEPCGADYHAEAVESANAVVVIVTADPNQSGDACPSIGATRTTSVELAEPLGERAVLEVQLGTPVPIRVTG